MKTYHTEDTIKELIPGITDESIDYLAGYERGGIIRNIKYLDAGLLCEKEILSKEFMYYRHFDPPIPLSESDAVHTEGISLEQSIKDGKIIDPESGEDVLIVIGDVIVEYTVQIPILSENQVYLTDNKDAIAADFKAFMSKWNMEEKDLYYVNRISENVSK